MKLVVGLGNPGQKYKNTRHNVGFWVVDRLAGEEAEWKVSKTTGALYYWTVMGDDDVELFKPQGYMNKSGVAVKKYLKKFKVTNLKDFYVVHDDLDIKLGEYKIGEKGPREHNGLKSIYEQIGTLRHGSGQVKFFNHVRIGIDNGEFRQSGEEYVLSNWKPEEKKIINQVIGKVVEELRDVLARKSS